MDQNESTIPLSMSDSRPISPSLVTVTAEVAPPATVKVEATVKEETNGEDLLPKKKRGRPRKCDSIGKSIKPSGTPEESSIRRSLRKRKGDPSMSHEGGGDFKSHILTVNTQESLTMDQNESIIPVSMSDSRPISPSPVTVTAEAAPPATVKEETNDGDMVAKKKRGRPRKSIKPSGTPKESSTKRSLRKRKGDDPSLNLGGGGDFKAHVLTINTHEDIIEKIMSFTQNGSRGICVLSANGAVSNVKIQPGFNRDVLTFKDAYEIISLSGSMMVSESGAVRNETGGWRISIGGANSCVFGGRLAGRLIAASPVQVVIGSFWPLVEKPSLKRNSESTSVAVVTPTIPNALLLFVSNN